MIHILTTTLVLGGVGYLFLTLWLSRSKKRLDPSGEEPGLFVFVVPALNEELVIASTVTNLLEISGDRGRVVVVDDGSTDSTAEILDGLACDRLFVLHRRLPNAQIGKGAALNDVYRRIRDAATSSGTSTSRVVLCIVDADGRLSPNALEEVGTYFANPRVGAVQLLVRIRNRSRWLCRFQDYEFLVFSSLTQTAREKLGSVGLGGNGQFTRLSALMGLGEEPWSDCLTEDLDLGVRLAIDGWENRFCGEAYVDQQGVTSVSRLVRQRTRWAHGHFQCWKLVPRVIASDMPTVSVLDMCYYLVAPASVLVQSLVFSGGWLWFGYSILTNPSIWLSPTAAVFVGLVYVISMGPALFLCNVYRRRCGELSILTTFLMAHLLIAYNYLWYLAWWKAIGRLARNKQGWSKTARTAEPAVVLAGVS